MSANNVEQQQETTARQISIFAISMAIWALTSGLAFICWVFVQDLNTYFVTRITASSPDINRFLAADILQYTQYIIVIIAGIIMGFVFIGGFDFYSKHFGKPIIWRVTRRILIVEIAIIVLWMILIGTF